MQLVFIFFVFVFWQNRVFFEGLLFEFMFSGIELFCKECYVEVVEYFIEVKWFVFGFQIEVFFKVYFYLVMCFEKWVS